MSLAIAAAVVAVSAVVLLYHVYHSLFRSPLSQIPGPRSFAVTKWRLAREDYRGSRPRTIHHLHQEYGPVVRVGPNEVSFNSLAGLRQIYGAGSAFGRPRSFYRMFDVHGQPHMFTVFSSSEHSARKKVQSQMYAKSTVLKSPVADSIESKVSQFLDLIESDPKTASHLMQSLHYYSFDNITWMVYRDGGGATATLAGRVHDRQILNDIDQATARKYSWFQTHLPEYTRVAMSCGFPLKEILDRIGLLPGKFPLAYSGLQEYALTTFRAYRQGQGLVSNNNDGGGLMMKLLNEQAKSSGKEPISDLEITAECADHLDAGLKTTSDSLLFALWALSLPVHQKYQQRLAAEVDSLSDMAGNKSISSAELCERLPFLDAVVKETLRLYSPIPGPQPRVSDRDVTVEGYHIPAGTIVSSQAYSLHRNPAVFPDPYQFNPDRWLAGDAEIAEMKRWWWPFSSGGRMCLGMHLALAEMKTLLVAIYQRYSTTLKPEFQTRSPVATSRTELLYDDLFPVTEGTACCVEFRKK